MKNFLDDKNVKDLSDIANIEALRIVNSLRKIIPITKPTASKHLIVLCAEHLTSKRNSMLCVQKEHNIMSQHDINFLIGQHFYFYAGVFLSLNVGADDYDKNPNSKNVAGVLGEILAKEIIELEKNLYKITRFK